MLEFAERTGLLSDSAPRRRYLWTDAFAVCNYLGIYLQTGEERYKRLALGLVDQVHNVLGRHRDDDPRTGWIGGMDEQSGSLHPTMGGLRIGKKLNERKHYDPYDEPLEWDRDGQYFHYLTKWMHALHRVSRITGDPIYHRWAVELAKAVHARFVYVTPSGKKRIFWKMSIELTYPLESSMGHHDPLDGFLTYLELQATAAKASESSVNRGIRSEIEDMSDMIKGRKWATSDPLGIGELLSSSYKLSQLIICEGVEQTDLLSVLLDASLISLRNYVKSNSSALSADHRGAFRELGLCIGLHAVEKLQKLMNQASNDSETKHSLHERAERLMNFVYLSKAIEGYWLDPGNRETDDWISHRDINMVMLATCLAPDGYLSL